MARAALLVPVLVVLLLVSGSFQKVSYGLDTPQAIYPGCFCFYEWNDANRVGNWLFEENWLQLEEPDAVAFVRISGDNTITLTKERQVNQLTLGENRWDTTRLVLEEDLIIVYDDQPEIKHAAAERLATGEVVLTLQGKGFGFDSSSISITVTEHAEQNLNQVRTALVESAVNTYTCTDVTLQFRDAKVVCKFSPYRLLPHELSIALTANGKSAQKILLLDYIQ